MNTRATFASVFLVALLAAAPASAGPIQAALAAIQAFAATSAVAAFVVRIGFSLVFSALAQALAPETRKPGIKTEATTSGGDNSQSFILGLYATAGNRAAPPYSHPNSGGKPNKWLTYVVDASDMPGVQLSRVMVSGEYVTDLEPAPSGDHAQQGMIVDGEPHLFLTWHDGHQTAADAYMMANYSVHPDRPWGADMVGTGVAYGVFTFRYNRELFNSLPGLRLEVQGIPLYDPRLDSSVGGSGAHRWNDPATWEFSANPAVMIYNILRGITLPDGKVWGGQASADSLPLDNWFAAMNECDAPVDLAGGGTEPQYIAGLEVAVADDEPAAVIEELMKACSAEISEFGGIYKLRVGPPALPVYFFTDADVVADEPQSLAPYPGLDGVHNAIHAAHPSPAALWEPRDAPPRYNAEWEAEDGGRQLVAHVQLPAVASDTQVQRLMAAWIEDERRFRRHSLTLPPEAAVLEPLDCAAWTSEREGYDTKVFEVGELTDHQGTMLQAVVVREREAGDFAWEPSDEITVAHPSPVVTVPGARVLEGFDLVKHALVDAAAQARRPALRLVWDGAAVELHEALAYEVQLADGTPVASGPVSNAASGEVLVSAGILPATTYHARARVVSAGASEWTAWATATTDDLRLPGDDLADEVQDQLATADQAAADLAVVVAGYDGTLADLEAADATTTAVTARLMGGGVALNPTLQIWSDPAAAPDGFVVYPGAGGSFAQIVEADGSYTLELETAGAPAEDRPILAMSGGFDGNGAMPAHVTEKIKVTIRAELLAGDWSGAAIRAFWRDDGSVGRYSAAETLADLGVGGEVGVVKEITTFIDRPEGFTYGTNGDNFIQARLHANHGADVYCKIKVHAFDVAPVEAHATAGMLQSVVAGFGALYRLEAKAGTSGAELELLAPDGGQSVARLAADNILLDGTVGVEKLVSGAGGNQIQNSRFEAGLYNWVHAGSGLAHDNTTLFLRQAGSGWAGRNYPTLAMHQASADASGYSLAQCGFAHEGGVTFNDGFPVTPGEWVGVAARVSTHRCSGDVRLVFRNATGGLISAHDADVPNDVQSSSSNPEEWPLYWVHAEVPAGAVSAQLWLQKWFTTSGTSSWLFAHKPYSFRSHASATEPPEWQPEGVTMVHGGQLVTDSVTADKMSVSELSAITATLGTFQSAAAGERVEIKDDRILVYDAGNNVRVKIGDLS